MFSGVVVLGVWAPVAALALPEMLPVVFSGGGVVVLGLAEPLTPPVLLCAPAPVVVSVELPTAPVVSPV